MLATETSTGTWVAIGTLVCLMIPVYIASLKGAQSYGRLEQKVDQLASAQAQAASDSAATQKLLADVVTRLTDQFQAHAVQDAGHFGELRGLLGQTQTVKAD